MPHKTPEQSVANYQSAMANPTTQGNYKKGIQAFNGNPMALAASPEAMQRYQDGITRSIASGKRVNSLMAASPTDWKNNAVTVGAPNLASGARKAAPKQLRFYQKAAPIWDRMKQASMAVGGSGLAAAQAKSAAALAELMQGFGKA